MHLVKNLDRAHQENFKIFKSQNLLPLFFQVSVIHLPNKYMLSMLTKTVYLLNAFHVSGTLLDTGIQH